MEAASQTNAAAFMSFGIMDAAAVIHNIPGFVLLYRFFCSYRSNSGFPLFYCINFPYSTAAIRDSLVCTVYIPLVLPQQSRFLSFLLYKSLLFYRNNLGFSRFYCINPPYSTTIIRDSLVFTVYIPLVLPQQSDFLSFLLYESLLFYHNNPSFSHSYCINLSCSTAIIRDSLIFTVYIPLVLP